MTALDELLDRLDKVAPQIAAHAGDDTDREEAVRLLRETGVPSATIPAAFGGSGLPISAASALLAQVARIDGSLALILAMHFIHSTRFFARESVPERMVDLARQLAKSAGLVNFVSSEGLSGAPSRGGPTRTTARKLSDGRWQLNGTKSYATGSSYLEAVLVTARIVEPDQAEENASVGVFLIPLPSKGARIEPVWQAFGMSASASHDLVLNDVILAPDAFLETIVNGGLTNQTHLFGVLWSTMLASVHYGLANGARAMALEYARSPRLDGGDGTFAQLPRVQDAAARMELALLTAQAALERALRVGESKPDAAASTLAGATRIIVHTEASNALDQATRIIGGASVRFGNPIQRHYRDLRVAFFNPPNQDVILAGLARQILELDQGTSVDKPAPTGKSHVEI